MASHGEEDDLGLLLSLRERVPETPPGSPPPSSPSHVQGYAFGDGSPSRPRATADMSVFRDAVKDYLGGELDADDAFTAAHKPDKPKGGDDVVLERFSGLRIRNLLVSGVELNNHFSDVRFIRLPAIRNSMVGVTISGCWTTVGVLTEKGKPKLSSAGKNFCVWKIGSLDESVVSVFLFGDAFTKNSEASVGTVFALFNASIRKDGDAFSLSVYSAGQILKMGRSVDYGVCKGKRKDGMPCTMVINKRRGIYCKYHLSNASQKYSTMRSELKGGNLRTTFRRQSEGVYLVDPLKGRSNMSKPMQPLKVLSVDGLKRVLSNAGKVTTNCQSQGIRFLSQVTAKSELRSRDKGYAKSNQCDGKFGKRLPSDMKMSGNAAMIKEQPETKRTKSSHKIIELEIFNSDEEG